MNEVTISAEEGDDCGTALVYTYQGNPVKMEGQGPASGAIPEPK